MIPLGLTASEHADYNTLLADSHSINVTLQVLNLSHDRLADVSGMLLDGQVDVDADADVTRTCTLALLDPYRRLHFDSDSPADGALYMDRMIRVVYSVKHSTMGWVDCPVFTGPVTKMDREDDVVHLECGGKEILAMGAAWTPTVYRKGTNKVNVVRRIMRDIAGESRFSLDTSTHRLRRDFSLARDSVPWTAALKVSHSMHKQLFYDGRGVLRMRSFPKGILYRFNHGDGGMVLTEPQITYSTDDVKNAVWVKGGKPKGAKKAISYWVVAPRSHPLSPHRLGRTNSAGTFVPRRIVEVIENSDIVSLSEAKTLASSTLDDKLLEQVDVTFESLPNPQFDIRDRCVVHTPEFSLPFRLKQYTLPLTTGEAMSIGFHKNVMISRADIRRR